MNIAASIDLHQSLLSNAGKGCPSMYDKHLDSFITLVEAKSFAQAAQKLYISRTALRQQITLLERDLNVKLINCNSQGVTLTEAGQYFYNKSVKLVTAAKKIMSECKEIDKHSDRTVRIGTLPNFNAVIIPRICRKYKELYPDVKIKFVERPLDNYFRSLLNDEFDIAAEYMFGYSFRDTSCARIKLVEDTHSIGIPHNHPLAKKKNITLADLQNCKIAIYKSGTTKADDNLRNYLIKNVPSIKFKDIKEYGKELSLVCELEESLLVMYSLYEESFLDMRAISLPVSFPVDLGLLSRKNTNSAVKNFITLAQTMYQQNN